MLFSIQCLTCAAFHLITRVPNLAGAGNWPAETQARNVRASTHKAAVSFLLSMNCGNKSDVDALIVQVLEHASLRMAKWSTNIFLQCFHLQARLNLPRLLNVASHFLNLTIREVTCQRMKAQFWDLPSNTSAGLFSFLLRSIVHTIRLLSNVCTAFEENSFINQVSGFYCA